MPNRLITIAIYNNPTDAHIAKSMIEAEGIPCFLKDEYMAGMYVSLLVGGVKLQVPREYANDALEILGKEPQPAFEIEQDSCPICNAPLFAIKKSWWSRLMAYLQKQETGEPEVRFECRNCGYQWP